MTALSGAIAAGVLEHQATHRHLARDVTKCRCRGVKLGCELCAKDEKAPAPASPVTSRPKVYGEFRGRRIQVLGVDGAWTFWRTSDGTCTGWADSAQVIIEKEAAA